MLGPNIPAHRLPNGAEVRYRAAPAPLGFAAPPPRLLALVLGIVLSYGACSEASRRTILRRTSL